MQKVCQFIVYLEHNKECHIIIGLDMRSMVDMLTRSIKHAMGTRDSYAFGGEPTNTTTSLCKGFTCSELMVFSYGDKEPI